MLPVRQVFLSGLQALFAIDTETPGCPRIVQDHDLTTVQAIFVQLLQTNRATLKFIVNDSTIAFLLATQQHRDLKVGGLSYEDDYLGNALAGVITSNRVEIRFHRDFSDEDVKRIWSRVLGIQEVARARLGRLFYQGRELSVGIQRT